VPPRSAGRDFARTVEYSLTPLGETLIPVLAAVRDWAEEHITEVLDSHPLAAASDDGQTSRVGRPSLPQIAHCGGADLCGLCGGLRHKLRKASSLPPWPAAALA
jgi:hypothetical protein